MGVKLLQLERKEIRKKIRFEDENGVTQVIQIFEPSQEISERLSKILLEHSEINKEEMVIGLPSNLVISEFLKNLTDIEVPEDQETIDKIIENPSLVFQTVLSEITEIVTQLMTATIQTMKNINKINELSQDINREDAIKILDAQKQVETAKKAVEDSKAEEVTQEIKPKAKRNRAKKTE